MNYKLPDNFSLCTEDVEAVRITRRDNGFFGEVINFKAQPYGHGHGMYWTNRDIVLWLESRTIPATRPAEAMKKSLAYLNLEEWDLDMLMLKTRGFRWRDRHWLRLAESETFNAMAPHTHPEAYAFLDVMTRYPAGLIWEDVVTPRETIYIPSMSWDKVFKPKTDDNTQ